MHDIFSRTCSSRWDLIYDRDISLMFTIVDGICTGQLFRTH